MVLICKVKIFTRIVITFNYYCSRVGKLAKPPHFECGVLKVRPLPRLLYYLPLAQQVERRTVNANVHGSSP